MTETTLKTLKVRVKDNKQKVLSGMAYAVNQIWNNANAITSEYSNVPIPGYGWLCQKFSAFDLSKEQAKYAAKRGLSIHSQTIQETTEAHAKARKQSKKDKLKWRSSSGSRRALGWVPFKSGAAKWKNGSIYFNGHYFKCWDSYGLSKYKFKSGSFSEDSRGRWYFNVVVEVEKELSGTGQIGIDFGLKDTATCSNGERLDRGDFYRNLENKLAKAQRAKKKKLVKTIHAKIKNKRNDAIHKFTNKLTKENGLIIVGNVSSSKLAKTKMAKSVLDAGWFMLKKQLEYKAIGRQAMFLEVNESYTTQTCSCCGCIGPNSPKGRADLDKRFWQCSECGASHDRDINASANILRLGHEALRGIPDL